MEVGGHPSYQRGQDVAQTDLIPLDEASFIGPSCWFRQTLFLESPKEQGPRQQRFRRQHLRSVVRSPITEGLFVVSLGKSSRARHHEAPWEGELAPCP